MTSDLVHLQSIRQLWLGLLELEDGSSPFIAEDMEVSSKQDIPDILRTVKWSFTEDWIASAVKSPMCSKHFFLRKPGRCLRLSPLCRRFPVSTHTLSSWNSNSNGNIQVPQSYLSKSNPSIVLLIRLKSISLTSTSFGVTGAPPTPRPMVSLRGIGQACGRGRVDGPSLAASTSLWEEDVITSSSVVLSAVSSSIKWSTVQWIIMTNRGSMFRSMNSQSRLLNNVISAVVLLTIPHFSLSRQ